MAEFAAPDGKLSKHNKRAARIKRDAVCISGAYGSYYNKKATDSHCKDQQVGVSRTNLSTIMRVMRKMKYR